MKIELDHTIVPARNQQASAEKLAAILDVPWSVHGVGPFCPVYVNEGLTLDIDQAHGPTDMQVNTQYGGRIVYWSEPDGHVWEALTVSYARRTHEQATSGGQSLHPGQAPE
jgi:hypothetical protein